MCDTFPPPHSISLMYSFSFNHQFVVLLPLVLVPLFSVASSCAQQLQCNWPWASHLSCSLSPSPNNVLSFFHPLVPPSSADSKLCPLFSSVNSCFAMNFHLLFPTFNLLPHNLSQVSTLTDLSSTNHSWVNVASLSKKQDNGMWLCLKSHSILSDYCNHPQRPWTVVQSFGEWQPSLLLVALLPFMCPTLLCPGPLPPVLPPTPMLNLVEVEAWLPCLQVLSRWPQNSWMPQGKRFGNMKRDFSFTSIST